MNPQPERRPFGRRASVRPMAEKEPASLDDLLRVLRLIQHDTAGVRSAVQWLLVIALAGVVGGVVLWVVASSDSGANLGLLLKT